MPGTDRVRKVGGSRKIPGAGPIVATALIAEVGDWFSSGRNLADWIGLVPKQLRPAIANAG
jgi:transposase